MNDIASLRSATGNLQVATNIISSFSKLKLTPDLQKQVMELQQVILTALSSALEAQRDELAMLERVRSLETQVAKHEAWEAEKQRYELTELPPGVFVYSLKPTMANGEHPHQICERCYQEGKKSILQKTEPSNGLHHLKCSRCNTDLRVGRFDAPRFASGFGGDDRVGY